MFIDELQPEQKIDLMVKIAGQAMEFELFVKDTNSKKHTILTNVVYKDEKIVNLSGGGFLMEVHAYPGDGSPMVFKGVKLALMKDSKSGDFLYQITGPLEGKSFNRRENFRIYSGKEVVVQFGSNRSTDPAFIKDISATGVAIVTYNNEKVYKVGQIIHTVLNDIIEELNKKYSFQIYAIIVRVVELDNGNVVYGCKLNQKVPGLDQYIMTKERIRIKGEQKNNGNGR